MDDTDWQKRIDWAIERGIQNFIEAEWQEGRVFTVREATEVLDNNSVWEGSEEMATAAQRLGYLETGRRFLDTTAVAAAAVRLARDGALSLMGHNAQMWMTQPPRWQLFTRADSPPNLRSYEESKHRDLYDLNVPMEDMDVEVMSSGARERARESERDEGEEAPTTSGGEIRGVKRQWLDSTDVSLKKSRSDPSLNTGAMDAEILPGRLHSSASLPSTTSMGSAGKYTARIRTVLPSRFSPEFLPSPVADFPVDSTSPTGLLLRSLGETQTEGQWERERERERGGEGGREGKRERE